MAKKETLLTPSYIGLFRFGKEKSKIQISRETLIGITILLAIIVLLLNILVK